MPLSTLLRTHLVFLSLLMASAANAAEARRHLATVGDWALDRVDGMVVKDGETTSTFDNMCVAWTSQGGATLSLTMNARDSGVPEEFQQNIYLQLSSADWHYAFREQSLWFFSIGVFGAFNAWYFDDTIAWTIPDNGKPELSDFVADALGKSTVVGGSDSRELVDAMIAINPEGRTIATLSTRGMKEIYTLLLDCAGQGDQ